MSYLRDNETFLRHRVIFEVQLSYLRDSKTFLRLPEFFCKNEKGNKDILKSCYLIQKIKIRNETTISNALGLVLLIDYRI